MRGEAAGKCVMMNDDEAFHALLLCPPPSLPPCLPAGPFSAADRELKTLRAQRPQPGRRGCDDHNADYVWVPDYALHLEILVRGTSPLYAAVSSNQHEAVKLLLQAGANPLRCCFADPSEAYGNNPPTSGAEDSSSATDSSSGGKKKKKKAKASSSIPCWTTPLHEAGRRGDLAMLQLLLTHSTHPLPDKLQREFPAVVLPTDHCSDSEGSVHQRVQKLPVSVLDGAGQTPLSLALGSRNAAAAGVLLVQSGMLLLQPVRDPTDSSGQRATHALLLAAKVGGWEAEIASRRGRSWCHKPSEGGANSLSATKPVAGHIPYGSTCSKQGRTLGQHVHMGCCRQTMPTRQGCCM